MPFIETNEGYESSDSGGLKITTVAGLFSPLNIAKKLFSLCWSVARIARHLKIPQSEVRELLGLNKERNHE